MASQLRANVAAAVAARAATKAAEAADAELRAQAYVDGQELARLLSSAVANEEDAALVGCHLGCTARAGVASKLTAMGLAASVTGDSIAVTGITAWYQQQ